MRKMLINFYTYSSTSDIPGFAEMHPLSGPDRSWLPYSASNCQKFKKLLALDVMPDRLFWTQMVFYLHVAGYWTLELYPHMP
jgi:hypothetical protein